jgi:DNA-binding transcriptional ArsR family regulator
MVDYPDIAAVAALVADPTRARMLIALMHGRALTATELALAGGVTSSTTSSHLARLKAAGLVALARQGRHRYFRIARPEIAALIEGLSSIASGGATSAVTGPRDERLRRARVCYDHLAGERGVHLLDRLRAHALVTGDDDVVALTPAGEKWGVSLGIDVGALLRRRRPLCRTCLDWSERRTHLAGSFGAALLALLFTLRYARRDRDSRAVLLSPRGEAFLDHLATR